MPRMGATCSELQPRIRTMQEWRYLSNSLEILIKKYRIYIKKSIFQVILCKILTNVLAKRVYRDMKTQSCKVVGLLRYLVASKIREFKSKIPFISEKNCLPVRSKPEMLKKKYFCHTTLCILLCILSKYMLVKAKRKLQ